MFLRWEHCLLTGATAHTASIAASRVRDKIGRSAHAVARRLHRLAGRPKHEWTVSDGTSNEIYSGPLQLHDPWAHAALEPRPCRTGDGIEAWSRYSALNGAPYRKDVCAAISAQLPASALPFCPPPLGVLHNVFENFSLDGVSLAFCRPQAALEEVPDVPAFARDFPDLQTTASLNGTVPQTSTNRYNLYLAADCSGDSDFGFDMVTMSLPYWREWFDQPRSMEPPLR